MVAFQILSDLHLESPAAYDVFDIPPLAPYLALLGDIGIVKDDGLFSFLEIQLYRFENVYFLLGNHEPYNSTWEQAKEKIHSFAASIGSRRLSQESGLGQFIFLDQTRHDLSSDVTILGCTLFSKVSENQREGVSFGLNDFYHIEDWTVDAHTAAHEDDLNWLNHQVTQISTAEPQRKIIIFTHYSPVDKDPRAVNPLHANSPISSGFATDLSLQDCWKSPSVKLWAYGHTHYNICYKDDAHDKLIVSNQRGYYFSQADRFDIEYVLYIE